MTAPVLPPPAMSLTPPQLVAKTLQGSLYLLPEIRAVAIRLAPGYLPEATTLAEQAFDLMNQYLFDSVLFDRTQYPLCVNEYQMMLRCLTGAPRRSWLWADICYPLSLPREIGALIELARTSAGARVAFHSSFQRAQRWIRWAQKGVVQGALSGEIANGRLIPISVGYGGALYHVPQAQAVYFIASGLTDIADWQTGLTLGLEFAALQHCTTLVTDLRCLTSHSATFNRFLTESGVGARLAASFSEWHVLTGGLPLEELLPWEVLEQAKAAGLCVTASLCFKLAPWPQCQVSCLADAACRPELMGPPPEVLPI